MKISRTLLPLLLIAGILCSLFIPSEGKSNHPYSFVDLKKKLNQSHLHLKIINRHIYFVGQRRWYGRSVGYRGGYGLGRRYGYGGYGRYGRYGRGYGYGRNRRYGYGRRRYG